jgi:hypothetical protein
MDPKEMCASAPSVQVSGTGSELVKQILTLS